MGGGGCDRIEIRDDSNLLRELLNSILISRLCVLVVLAVQGPAECGAQKPFTDAFQTTIFGYMAETTDDDDGKYLPSGFYNDNFHVLMIG